MKAILLVAVAGLLAVGCERTRPTEASGLEYPYVAPEARARRIVTGYPRIEQGMIAEEVEAMLGPPDEVHPLYELRMKRPRQIGRSWVYILERSRPDAQLTGRREAIVRLGLDGKVTETVPVGDFETGEPLPGAVR